MFGCLLFSINDKGNIAFSILLLADSCEINLKSSIPSFFFHVLFCFVLFVCLFVCCFFFLRFQKCKLKIQFVMKETFEKHFKTKASEKVKFVELAATC